MTSAETSELMAVWGRVSRWSEPMKVSLATRILQSLQAELSKGGERFQPGPRKTPADLIGAWKVDPPPSDEEIEKILEEEKMKKFRNPPG